MGDITRGAGGVHGRRTLITAAPAALAAMAAAFTAGSFQSQHPALRSEPPRLQRVVVKRRVGAGASPSRRRRKRGDGGHRSQRKLAARQALGEAIRKRRKAGIFRHGKQVAGWEWQQWRRRQADGRLLRAA